MGRVKMMRYFLCTAVFVCTFAVATVAYTGVVDKVIVVVNEEVITQREFDRVFVPIKENFEQNFRGEELDRRIDEAKKGLLEQLINTKLAVSLAKKQNVKVNEDELKQRIDKVRSFYSTEEEFLIALNEKGTNLTEFEKEIREQMLAQALVQKEVGARIVIAPKEVQQLYEKNKDKLVTPHTVKVRGIMIRKPEVAGDRTGRKKMEVIINKLEKGRKFDAMAKENSEGPFAENGGDMGYIPQGQMLPEIDKVIFAMQMGEISEMIETPVGYHVFLVEDIKTPQPLEYKEVSDFLKNQLYMRQFQQKLYEWLAEKRKNAYISYK